MLDTHSKLKSANIGDRIECTGSYGTVRYVGEIDGHAGSWVGVDWDDPTRGKHNGCVKGKQYFIASSDTSGSFLRLEKVQFGQTLITAITSRYGQKDDELTAKIHQQQLLSIMQNMNAPLLEFVGFDKIIDKQGNYHDLKVVNARLQNVSSVGEPYDLKHYFPNIAQLDISKNLINSWTSIFQISDELVNLVWLNVSQNHLEIPDDYTSHHYPNLKSLICGSMQITWPDLMKLCHVFPNLEEIIAPNNAITSLDLNDTQLRNLKTLDLDGNCIGDWTEVCKLGTLEALEWLNLYNAGISRIYFEADGKTDLFKNLSVLYLRDNFINEWESVGELDKLQHLEHLKFMKNPILETETLAMCEQIIIGRIENLKMLNAVDITEERKGAEFDYLKKYGLEWLSVKSDEEKRADFLKRHNRYSSLINKYGELEETELKVQTKTIKTSLIEVKLLCEGNIVVKKLPPTILIQKLIMLVQRLFRLTDRPTLVYTSSEHPDIEIALDDECKELGIYSIQNDDVIVVKP